MEFVNDQSLVLYLPLHEKDGASFVSKDRHAHLCTATGAVWRLNGRYFDGLDDRINCGNSQVFQDITAEVTAVAWINPATGQTGEDCIVGKMNDSGVNRRSWMFVLPATGKLALYISADGLHYDTNALIAPNILAKDQWVFVAGSYKSAHWFLVENGNVVVSGTPVPAGIDSNTADDLYIGELASLTRPFIGHIGEVWVYNRALNPLEIQQNYLATKWRYG